MMVPAQYAPVLQKLALDRSPEGNRELAREALDKAKKKGPFGFSVVRGKKKEAEIDDLKQEKVDNVKSADDDVKANMRDNKKSLGDLFTKGKDNSVAKLFPGKSKKVTSDPFLKVAFAETMKHIRFEKTSGEIGVMFLGFQNELENIEASV